MKEPFTNVQATLQSVDPVAATRVATKMASVGHHAVFASIRTLEHVQIFMEHHVWAVWDFMSLLKSLQSEMAPAKVPWVPPADTASARLINEIVTDEEGDEGPDGNRASHFEIYLRAMDEVGANAAPIRAFTSEIAGGKRWDTALQGVPAPPAAPDFVRTTMEVIGRPLWARVSAFSIGREEVIPAMFSSLVAEVGAHEARLFRWYLQRHIDIDGNRHGPMSAGLFQRVCLVDEETRRRSVEVGLEVLTARIALWDAVLAAIQTSR